MTGTGEHFVVRQATMADEPAIARAWEAAYGALAVYKYPGRWRWNVLGNPWVSESRRPLAWLATDGNRIAAWTCAFVVPLLAGGRQVLGAHSVDTFTFPEFRRHGFGRELQSLNQRAHAVFIAIDPSPANRRNKYRVGGWPGRPLRTYLKVLGGLDGSRLFDSLCEAVGVRLGNGVARKLAAVRDMGGASMLGRLFTWGFRLRAALTRRGVSLTPRPLELREVAEFGPDADHLWEKVSSRYSFAARRDAGYLNWRYARHPNHAYRKFLAFESGQVVGALVYRDPVGSPEQPAGLVSECFCVDDAPTILASLYAHAEGDFASRGLPLVRCGASTAGQFQALEALGYQQVDIDVPVVHVAEGMEGLDRATLLAGDWLLGLGDSDLDQVREVHQPSFVESLRLFAGRIPGSENLPRG